MDKYYKVCLDVFMPVKCLECGEVKESVRSLSKHLRDSHGCGSKEYYDKHFGEGKCCVCGAATKFENLSVGYRPTCNHTCGAIMHRRLLRDDPGRNEEFIAKARANAETYWRTATPEEKSLRVAAVTASVKKLMSGLTLEERRHKFGWFARATPEKKKEWLAGIVETGAHRWWREASDEEKAAVIEKRTEAVMRSARGSAFDFDPDSLVIEPGLFEALDKFFEMA